METPEVSLRVWNVIADDFKGKFLIKVAFRVRYVLRKAAVAVRGWPYFAEAIIKPVLNWISRLLTKMLTGDLELALEVAVEYWIALRMYKSHSSWLVNPETAQDMAAEIRDQSQTVWKFIMDRQIESPDRFEAIQTYRATRAILYAQLEFVDGLFEHGLLEEVEHEHLTHELEHKRATLSRRGPVLHDFEVLEFLKKVPCFVNVSMDVFRAVISTCKLHLYRSEESLPAPSNDAVESFSFHIVVNGILKSSYRDSLGKDHEYHLGRGGVFGLLSALSGEHYSCIGKGYAELNALGYGPSVLTVPHSTLKKIHSQAQKGILQYQQLELDLFRLAALYIVEYSNDEILSLMTVLYLHQGDEKSKFVQSVKGSPFAVVSSEKLGEIENGAQVQESYKQALEALEKLKEGVLEAELVLLPPNVSFLQKTSSVLIVGSLMPQSATATTFVSPVVLPWSSSFPAVPMDYKAGPQGALIISCRGGGSVKDGGMRFGAEMASMPASAAAQMQSSLFQ